MSSTSSWRDALAERGIKIHPSADCFRDLTDAELDRLAKSIGENGLQRGVWLWTPDEKPYGDRPPPELWLVAGKQRLRGLDRAFDDPKQRSAALSIALDLADSSFMPLGPHIEGPRLFYGRTSPYELAKIENEDRRHDTPEARRAAVHRLLQQDPDRSDRAIAKEAGTSHHVVARARAKPMVNGTPSHKPADRTEASGRKARGRKAGTVPQKPARPAAPAVTIVTTAPDPVAEIARIIRTALPMSAAAEDQLLALFKEIEREIQDRRRDDGLDPETAARLAGQRNRTRAYRERKKNGRPRRSRKKGAAEPSEIRP